MTRSEIEALSEGEFLSLLQTTADDDDIDVKIIATSVDDCLLEVQKASMRGEHRVIVRLTGEMKDYEIACSLTSRCKKTFEASSQTSDRDEWFARVVQLAEQLRDEMIAVMKVSGTLVRLETETGDFLCSIVIDWFPAA